MMPGRGKGRQREAKPRVQHFKAKHQKKRFIRSKDPIIAVFMWGVQHSINELTTSVEPALLLPEDFRAFSKIRVENQFYNKENLPGHFKFKEYCPRVFHDLRKRFGMDDIDYMTSLITKPPHSIDSPGRSGAKFLTSYDQRLVIKSISSEEVALLHQILQPYHAHVVTSEGRTLLPQYMGTYRLTVNNAETYWMVMRNILSSTVKTHRKFDLKGSTVDRAASTKERAKTSPTLKDNDFVESGTKIVIGPEAKERFLKVLERDAEFLQHLNLMDYSLLVGIHDCTLPPDSDDERDEDDLEGEEWEEGNGYLSSDDVADAPQSPHTPSGDELGSSGEILDSPSSPEHAASPPVLVPPPEATEEPLSSSPLPEPPLLATAIKEEEEEEEEETAVAEASPPPPLEEQEPPLSGATACTTPRPIVVEGRKEVQAAIAEGFCPVVDKSIDVFAVTSAPGASPQVYFMAIIDVLTNYGARKRAAHAAKTVKHGHGAEFSTVKPEMYARRFLDFMAKTVQ